MHNVGGGGDLTVGDGILVVEGLNNGPTEDVPHAFGLARRSLAGPYDYLLYRGGTGAGASDDWFLRSTFGPCRRNPDRNHLVPRPP